MSYEYDDLIAGKPISHMDQFLSIEAIWRELHAASCMKSIFLSFDYIKLWYTCFSSEEHVRIYPIVFENKLIGFFPLILMMHGPVRLLSSLNNDHCLHTGQLVVEGYEDVFEKSCIEALIQDKHNWDMLRYYSDGSFQCCVSFQNADIHQLHKREHVFPTYTILLPETYDEYFNQLTPKMRKSSRYEKNRLAKNDSHRYLHYTGSEAVAAWPTFLSIEDSGWKGAKASSILKLAENYRAYYDGLVDLLHRNKKLHIYFLEIDGQVVAGMFGYVDHDVFHACKSGYVETFSMYSPSNQLALYLIEDVIRNFPTVKRINLFPWGHGYKHRYINENLHCTDLSLFNSTIRGRVVYSAVSIKERIKSIPGLAKAIHFLRTYNAGSGNVKSER